MEHLIRIVVLSHDSHFIQLLLQELKRSEIHVSERVVQTRAAYTQALHEAKPDIILSEYALSHFYAIDAFKIKQELFPDVPFLVVATAIGEENAVDLIKMGVTDYVSKNKIRQVCYSLERAVTEAQAQWQQNRTRQAVQLREQEMQQQQEVIDNILGNVPNGFFVLTPDHVVAYWNHVAERMLKVPKEKILGKNPWNVFGKLIPAKFTDAYEQSITQQVSTSFECFMARSNSWFEVKLSSSAKGVVVFLRNITGKKRKEKLLLLEKEMLEGYTLHKKSFTEVITHLLNGIKGIYPGMSLALYKVEENLIYNWVCPHVPCEPEGIEQGMSLHTAPLPHARAAARKQVVEILDLPHQEEWKVFADLVAPCVVNALISYPLYDVNQHVIGVMTVFFEENRRITSSEQKAVLQAISVLRQLIGLQLVEHAIRKSEQKYRILFHASPTPMWVYDTITFKFLDVNAAAIHHYGYSEQEFKSMTLFDIRPEEDREALAAALSLIDSGEQPKSPFRHRTKSGKIIWVDVQSNTFELKGRKARVVQATDVTEPLKHTQAMEEQNAMLREIAWMQSHVVRAPVARIMGLATLLNKSTQAPSLDREIVHHMLQSTKELDTVIRAIVQKAEKLHVYDQADAPSLPVT